VGCGVARLLLPTWPGCGHSGRRVGVGGGGVEGVGGMVWGARRSGAVRIMAWDLVHPCQASTWQLQGVPSRVDVDLKAGVPGHQPPCHLDPW
jgi:hypothetical protein